MKEEYEKAIYLLGLFYSACGLHANSKRCAILCVNEIIEACEYNNVEGCNTDWWNRVKTELEKL